LLVQVSCRVQPVQLTQQLSQACVCPGVDVVVVVTAAAVVVSVWWEQAKGQGQARFPLQSRSRALGQGM